MFLDILKTKEELEEEYKQRVVKEKQILENLNVKETKKIERILQKYNNNEPLYIEYEKITKINKNNDTYFKAKRTKMVISKENGWKLQDERFVKKNNFFTLKEIVSIIEKEERRKSFD